MKNWQLVETDGLPPVGAWLVYLAEPLFKLRVHSASCGMSGNNEKIVIVAGHFHFDAPAMTHYCEMIDGPQ